MATVQPVAGDKLNSPDHSLLHRQIASDTSAPVKSIDIDSDGAIQGGTPLFQNINPTNLLSNGDFEAWSAGASSAPDGWASTGTDAREGAIKKIGNYSAKLSGSSVYYLQQSHYEKGIAYWQGRTVTLGCWVYGETGNSYIAIADGVGASSGRHSTGSASWEWITVTRTIDSSATTIENYLFVGGTPDGDTFFDGAMLVEGSSAFAFADKPMPEVSPTARGILTLEQGQIKFPATANASADANTLDDYEEGYSITTIVGATSGSYVLANNYLAYTKVGRVVHLQGLLTITSESSPSGVLRVSLPFNTASLTEGAEVATGSLVLYNHGGTIPNGVSIDMGPSTAYFIIQTVADDGTRTYIDESKVDTAWGLYVNLTYIAT